jgi:hypothetical protein
MNELMNELIPRIAAERARLLGIIADRDEMIRWCEKRFNWYQKQLEETR